MWRHLGCSSGSLGSRLHWSPRGGVEPTGSNFDRIRNASPAEGIPLQFRKDGDLGTSPFLSSSWSRCSSRPASGYSILYRSGKRREKGKRAVRATASCAFETFEATSRIDVKRPSRITVVCVAAGWFRPFAPYFEIDGRLNSPWYWSSHRVEA